MSVSHNWLMIHQTGYKAHKYASFAKLVDEHGWGVAYVQAAHIISAPELVSMTVLTSPRENTFKTIYVPGQNVANIAQVFADMLPPF